MNERVVPTTPKKAPRNSSLELLRILSMLMIVSAHYFSHGDFDFGPALQLNHVWQAMITVGANLGVNCFVLISGYFLCKQPQFNWKKVFRFILEVSVYSLIIYALSLALGARAFSLKVLIALSVPLFFSEWWFASTYVIFLILAPLLSMASEKMDQKLHLNLLALFTLLWVIVPTFTNIQLQYNDLIWFIYLFFCAAYIRKYPHPRLFSRKWAIMAGAISYGFIVLSTIGIRLLGQRIGVLASYAAYFRDKSKLPMTVLALALFVFFLNLKPFTSKPINRIASLMFGVYLIHDSGSLRGFMWRTLLQCSAHSASPYLILHFIVSIVAVFAACLILSFIIDLVFRRPLDAVSAWLAKLATRLYDGVASGLASKVSKLSDE